MLKAEEYNNKGIHFIQTSQIDQALKYFEKSIEEDKFYTDPYYNKAIAHLTMEDFDNALKCYNNILEIDPLQGEAYYQKANILFFIKDDLDEALNLYNKAIFLGVKNSNLFNNLSLCQQKKGNLEQAIMWNERALRIEPEKVDFLNKRAELFIKSSKLREALDIYNSILMIDVSNEEANHFKAVILGEMGDFDEALKSLEFSEEMLPESMLIKYDKVLMFERQGEFNKALEYISECEKVDSSNLQVLNKKAELYFSISNEEKALEVYDEIIKMYPDNFEAFFNKANGLMIVKKYKEANELYNYILENAEDKNPYKINSYYYSALSLKSLDDSNYIDIYKNAIKQYSNLMLYYEYDPTIYMLKANSYRDIDKYIEAEELYEFAIDLSPNSAEIYLMRAKNRIKLNNMTLAKKDIEKAIDINPYYNRILQADEELKMCFR